MVLQMDNKNNNNKVPFTALEKLDSCIDSTVGYGIFIGETSVSPFSLTVDY